MREGNSRGGNSRDNRPRGGSSRYRDNRRAPRDARDRDANSSEDRDLNESSRGRSSYRDSNREDDGRGEREPRNDSRERGGYARESRYSDRDSSRKRSYSSRSRGGYRGNNGGGRRQNSRDSDNGFHDGGNQRERITIESGSLVIIDQFMLANRSFVTKFMEIIDQGEPAKQDLIKHYGGLVVKLKPGTYKLDRDPYKFSIVIHQEGSEFDLVPEEKESFEKLGTVYVDTRCIAMVDRELLDDSTILERYQQLWFSGQDKSCRDFLRDNGGAVRYGFSKNNDDLNIYKIPNEETICLLPDIAVQEEEKENEAETKEA